MFPLLLIFSIWVVPFDSVFTLISGHQRKQSLEIYQHLSLKSVEQVYQEAVKLIEV